MKKLLIVNNNMKIGGVQKSLYNLLWNIHEEYEISLYLFQKEGEYLSSLPSDVRVLEDHSLFSLLGCSQGECRGLRRWTRGLLVLLTRTFGRHRVMKLLLLSKKTIKEEYDCAISFLHNGLPKQFYGGVQDFVLDRVKAGKKIAFLHCDYATCGAHERHNDRLMERFHAVAACSAGCRAAFVSALPHLAERCTVVHNFHRYDEIVALSAQNPKTYESGFLHLLMVCRMAYEKGVERAISAVKQAKDAGFLLKLHLVGDGAMTQKWKQLCKQEKLEDTVCFHGEQSNPYAYMKNADLFLISSLHEAAPMVIEEAAALALPVLSVRTTSAEEMVAQKGRGWVCDNTDEALTAELLHLLAMPQLLTECRASLQKMSNMNDLARREFTSLVD